ncbi:jg5329 [Pararge aegeria aegeria]|uniref:Jg5329 protein n=1 Tax=Pararge aegeria aegeria TaxID=348720 RepID=A0A8S4R9E2_9NEOP|nr:jg5329 [Pararge aegeria aegeria]
MDPSRLPRQVLLGVVAHAKRPVGRPRLRFKDCAKRDITGFNIDRRHSERLSEGRDEWRKSINEACRIYDEGIPRDLQITPKGSTAIFVAENVARASAYLAIQKSVA